MTLREKLSRSISFESPALPAFTKMTAAKERILGRWPDVTPDPPERDRERLVTEMKDRLARDHWNGAYLSFVTAAARAAFDPERRERSDLAGLRAFYVDEIRASKSRTFLSAMCSVYLGSFVPDAPHTKALSAALRDAVDRVGASWRQLFDKVPTILTPNAAPQAIAGLMTGMADPFRELKALGLRSPHATGLMDHAHLAYVAKLEAELSKRDGLDKLFQWIKPDGQSARVSGGAEAINAILGHWRNRNPSPGEITHITQSLIGFYGDPRIQRGGAWAGVDADRLAVILRWLTGENIRFFLDVISKVDTGHMYEPRRKFWLQQYEQGRIDAAWVAFGKDAAAYARKIVSSKGSGSSLNFGLQTARSKANTSIILMQIGKHIVVEGSELYYVHVFKNGHPNPPQLYKLHYDCIKIRDTPNVLQRAHSTGWQDWVIRTV